MRQKTIKSELLRTNVLFSLIIMIILGGGLSLLFYQARSDQIHKLLQSNNHALSSLLETAFRDARNTTEFLAEQDMVRNFSPNDLGSEQELKDFYLSIEKTNNRISHLYSGYMAQKHTVINNWANPPGYDPTRRPWYINAINAFPNAAVGRPYKDYGTDNWLISTSKVLINTDGAFAGVVSFDMNLDYIASLISTQHKINKSSYSYIVRKDGLIIFHPNPKIIGGNLFQDHVPSLPPESLRDQAGYLHYTFEDKSRIAYYDHIPGTDWIITSAITKFDIFRQLFWQAALCFAVVLVVSISWALWQSKNTVEKIIDPLHQLQNQMESIISGTANAEHNWNYPDNEIGDIARNATQLAEKELVAKNATLKTLNDQLEQEKQNLQKMSNTDQLTQINNRRSLDRYLVQELTRFQRYSNPLTMLMIDIDRFKQINDTLGHIVGDKVLVEVAQLMKATVREADIIGRWGGEEFMVICPETDLVGGVAVAEKIWTKVRTYPFTADTKVTVSIGVSQIETGQNIDKLIQDVDIKLYLAKSQGRDQVVSTVSAPGKTSQAN